MKNLFDGLDKIHDTRTGLWENALIQLLIYPTAFRRTTTYGCSISTTEDL